MKFPVSIRYISIRFNVDTTLISTLKRRRLLILRKAVLFPSYATEDFEVLRSTHLIVTIVDEFDFASDGQQNIGSFNIPMHDVISMQVFNSLELMGIWIY